MRYLTNELSSVPPRSEATPCAPILREMAYLGQENALVSWQASIDDGDLAGMSAGYGHLQGSVVHAGGLASGEKVGLMSSSDLRSVAEKPREQHSLREAWALETFMKLADALYREFDVVGLLTLMGERLTALLGVREVGFLILDRDKGLRVRASSVPGAYDVELFELQGDEGPFSEVRRSGKSVLNVPLAGHARWPTFAARARAAGYQMAHALPMRHRDDVVGVVNLFDDKSVALNPHQADLAQALADIVTSAVLQDRSLQQATELAEQLQSALTSRIVVEQAKGILSEQLKIEIEPAFVLLRSYSRNRNERISVVAARIVRHEIAPAEVLGGARARRARRASR